MADRIWRTTDFDYHLPAELIAQTPSPERGASRLLVVDRSSTDLRSPFSDLRFTDLSELLSPGDLLVRNSTRVRHARFIATRPSGEPAEVLLLHPAGDGTWMAMGKPGRALRPGKLVHLADGASIETVAVDEDGLRRVRFVGITDDDAIARFGRLPLPPYIDRDPVADDELRYQTVYAEREGSVAAPTAGLHFTAELLSRIEAAGVGVVDLDLEVGPGTFKPVEVDDPSEHPIHSERFTIPESTAAAVRDARRRGGRVWAVGTTVVRALESAASGDGTVTPGTTETRLMITPGYRFKVTDRLITNFHLPRSTLLMLVAAFAGYDLVMAAYRHAVESRYRFYSYGDAMCIL
ncbi:MAG TPA: tRNA preQ1(34) S-adenosylmethionine ribosyltransferase-isomerase QueA [Gemmatimonadales bacterium]|nr:tRNA preQ1(34) S-adenosylmethionine ribosyltransferase-isomerase QueA [Gemmatimonadales bacterium]